MRFVVATFNPDKLAELQRLLDRLDIELVSLVDVAGARAPEETGATLTENARLKARAALALTGLAAIADDTGLEVDALGGRPGVHSARFAGPRANDADNVAKLLEALRDVPIERRTARFRTVCMACFPDGEECQGEGVLEGRIESSPRGTSGFGYDPVFGMAEGRTLAELAEAEKNALSHRARAVDDLARKLAASGRIVSKA